MRLKIRGRWWTLILGKPPYGLCDGSCDINTRTIYIRKNCEDHRGAIIHELLHAVLWDLDESVIIEAEAALSKGLDELEKWQRKGLLPAHTLD